MKTVEFDKSMEIKNFGLAGKTCGLKGDPLDRVGLITQDFQDGTVAVMLYETDGRFSIHGRIPLLCVNVVNKNDNK